MKHRANDERESIRDALERATRVPRPDTDALLARVPVVLAEASRRGLRPRREDAFSAMVSMAARALPRLAAVAALFVVVAAGLHWNAGAAHGTASRSVESLVLTGDDSDIADDLVLETILEDGNG